MGLVKHDDNNSGVYYSIGFEHDGVHYEGRLAPEFKKGKDEPSSWHVVLNDVFFGYLHKDGSHWEVSEQRPSGLAEKVGQQIETRTWQIHRI